MLLPLPLTVTAMLRTVDDAASARVRTTPRKGHAIARTVLFYH